MKKSTQYAPEARELRQTNEILRKASAYFAQAELDRHFERRAIGPILRMRSWARTSAMRAAAGEFRRRPWQSGRLSAA
jgi:hypothetical protein